MMSAHVSKWARERTDLSWDRQASQGTRADTPSWHVENISLWIVVPASFDISVLLAQFSCQLVEITSQEIKLLPRSEGIIYQKCAHLQHNEFIMDLLKTALSLFLLSATIFLRSVCLACRQPAVLFVSVQPLWGLLNVSDPLSFMERLPLVPNYLWFYGQTCVSPPLNLSLWNMAWPWVQVGEKTRHID